MSDVRVGVRSHRFVHNGKEEGMDDAQGVPYKKFGLTYEEYRHAYGVLGNSFAIKDCTCKGCESPIHIDQHYSEEDSWCHVLYFDGDEGVALFEYEYEIPCYSGTGFSMKTFFGPPSPPSQYCEIPTRHMKAIIEIFEMFGELYEEPQTTLEGGSGNGS
tara:strand:- start:77 stop:553 length:477 start_codon:yes stop_codon:yes gene_type:complete